MSILLIISLVNKADLTPKHPTFVRLMEQPLFIECHFDIDDAHTWDDFRRERRKILQVWGYVKDYLGRVRHLQSDNAQDLWAEIRATIVVDDNSQYVTRDQLVIDWIEGRVREDTKHNTLATNVLKKSQKLRSLQSNHPLLQRVPPPPAPSTNRVSPQGLQPPNTGGDSSPRRASRRDEREEEDPKEQEEKEEEDPEDQEEDPKDPEELEKTPGEPMDHDEEMQARPRNPVGEGSRTDAQLAPNADNSPQPRVDDRIDVDELSALTDEQLLDRYIE